MKSRPVGLRTGRGISPVVGVILLIALTVVLLGLLAAGIFGGGFSSTHTQADLVFDENQTSDNVVTITAGVRSITDGGEVHLYEPTDSCNVPDQQATAKGDLLEVYCRNGTTITAIGDTDGSERVLERYHFQVFEITALEVPDRATPAETVTIDVTVVNRAGIDDTDQIILELDGQTVESESFYLEGDEERTVSYDVELDHHGESSATITSRVDGDVVADTIDIE